MSNHRHRRLVLVVQALLLSLTLVAAAPVAAKQPPAAANPAVITTWNEIAVTTVTGPAPNGAGMAGPTAFNYFAFTQIAVYNAVVGITGEYELYRWNAKAPKGASPEAAAAAAAHRVLRHYFGTGYGTAIAPNLDARLAASLALVPDGVPKDQGIRYGIRAADHIIALRANDGRGAAVVVPPPTGPGDWRPTPPAFPAFTSAWLGQVTPLALDSLDRFDPGPPPQIGSQTYIDEFEEVRTTGDINAPLAVRSFEMTQTAKFFSDAGITGMQRGLQDFALRHLLDIDDSARMFAAADTAIADGAGTVWNAKLQYLWWRPVTAIQLTVDPTWMPLITTPPYPEWPSGLCSVVGAASTVLTSLNGNGTLDLRIASPAAGETRTFATKAEIAQQAIDARVWSGIHFRTSDEVSITIGTNVANWVLDHYFQPTD
ncbi:MAG: vanadium-dependent haloperoxidase [Mycobacterium sp.]